MESLKLFSKSRKRRASPEAELQKAVVQYLNLAGVPGLLFFSVPNEQKCSVQRGAMLKKMGRRAGVSDLVILSPGQPILFLELKAKGEKQSDAQRAFECAAYEYGANYMVADNINEAISVLEECGATKVVPRRRASSPLSRKAA